MANTTNRTSIADLNRANAGKLPEHLGLSIIEVTDGKVAGRFEVRPTWWRIPVISSPAWC